MWSFVALEDGFQVKFPDGSATTLTSENTPKLATEYLENAVENKWPQDDAGVHIANPLAAAFHDLFKFMTPDGMAAYEQIPEMLKFQQVNPYIRGCLSLIFVIGAQPLLEQVSGPLWTDQITPADALAHTDECIDGGFEAAWNQIAGQ